MHTYTLFDTFCCESTDETCGEASWGLFVNFCKILIFSPHLNLSMQRLRLWSQPSKSRLLSGYVRNITKQRRPLLKHLSGRQVSSTSDIIGLLPVCV